MDGGCIFKTGLTIKVLHFHRVARIESHIFGISGIRKFF